MIHIRHATINDIDAVVELKVGLKKYYEKIGANPYVVQDKKSKVQKNIDKYYLAEYKNEVVGVIGFESNGHRGHITAVFVKPEYRGYGIGKALFDYIEKLAFELKLEYIQLTVRETNEVAKAFYNKRHFKPEAIILKKEIIEKVVDK